MTTEKEKVILGITCPKGHDFVTQGWIIVKSYEETGGRIWIDKVSATCPICSHTFTTDQHSGGTV